MLKNRTSDSRVSKDCEERIPVSSKRKEFYNKIIPVGSGNIDIDVECVEENGVVDLKSNLSASDVPRFVDGWPCEEGRFQKGSQSVELNLLKSTVSASSIFDLGCSDICTDNDEQSSHIRSSCDSRTSVATRETESTHECKVYNEAEEVGACFASTELGLAEDWPRRKMEIQILNHVVGCGTKEDKRGISSEARILESEEKLILSGCREYSSGIDSELNLIKQLNDPMVQENGPTGGMQIVCSDSYQAGIVLLDKLKLNHNAMSIEAKLLNPSRKLVPHMVGSCGEEVGVCDEFESGTQLNILMDLCCEMGEEGDSVRRTSSVEHFNLGAESIASRSLLVQCPLCQTDISKMSEEMRQIHTNDCLDKDDINAVKFSFT